MAQSRTAFINSIITAMVANSRYPILAGEPMPQSMTDEMTDSMERLADPIYTMVESFLFDPIQLEPSYQIRANIDDPLPGYLAAKVDDLTIKLNLSTFQLYVASVPLATSSTIGGVQIGAQPYLYIQGSNLMVNIETNPLLVGGDDTLPTSRAVKNYVDSIVTSGGGGGDMLRSTYDTNINGVVDDSERLGTQLPAYYLAWANFTGVPTTEAGYGITDGFTSWDFDYNDLINKPSYTQYWNKTLTTLYPATTGDSLAIDVINEYIPDAGVTIEGVKHIDWRTVYTETTEPTTPDPTTLSVFTVPDTYGAETDSVLKAKDENGNVFRVTHKRYVHAQGTAAQEWTINHNLGEEPNITVYDNNSPANKVWAPVKHVTVNQAVISMPTGVTLSGKAICII